MNNCTNFSLFLQIFANCTERIICLKFIITDDRLRLVNRSAWFKNLSIVARMALSEETLKGSPIVCFSDTNNLCKQVFSSTFVCCLMGVVISFWIENQSKTQLFCNNFVLFTYVT